MNLPTEKRIRFTCMVIGAVLDKVPCNNAKLMLPQLDFILSQLQEPPLTNEEMEEILEIHEMCWLHMKCLGLNRKQMRKH